MILQNSGGMIGASAGDIPIGGDEIMAHGIDGEEGNTTGSEERRRS